MTNHFDTQYVWTVGHECVALDGLTHRPHKEYSGTLVFVPSFFRIGLIEEGDGLLTGRFPKEYWESLGSDPHFKDFKEIDDRSFCCKGKLSDLMKALQCRAKLLQVARDLAEKKESVLSRLIGKWIGRKNDGF